MNGNLGKKLRQVRLRKEMTLKDLAKKCDLSISYISQIEREEANSSLSALNRHAKALGVTVWRLLREDDEVVYENQFNKNETEPQIVNDVKRVQFGVYPKNNYITQIRHVRKDGRKTITLPGSNTRYEMLTPDLNRKMQVLYMEAEAGVESGQDWFEHEGEECCVVLRGRLELEVGSEKFLLEEGDSLYFPSGIPHHWRNTGEEKVILMWILTPPAF